nr:MAG TPA: hypothetical protein [Bacteriophage sp.]
MPIFAIPKKYLTKVNKILDSLQYYYLMVIQYPNTLHIKHL